MPASWILASRRLAAVACAAALLGACSDDDNGGTGPGGATLMAWSFVSDLEGWEAGTADGESWGTVDWQQFDDDDPSGWIKLDGTGESGVPNSWISRAIALPANAATLRFLTAVHNRPSGNAALRVRVESGAGNQTLLDWESFNHTGTDGGDLVWVERSVSIAALAGQTVTLFFEQDDDGPGSHEQRYLDEIRIER